MTFQAPDLGEEEPDETPDTSSEGVSDEAPKKSWDTSLQKSFADGPAHDMVPRRELELQRRDEALRLRLGGYSYAQIAEAMGLSTSTVTAIITRALSAAPNEKAVEQRAIENARLDRLQAAVWTQALKGDLKAIDAVLRISRRRAEMNGLDAPKKIDLRASVRVDVEHAVRELHEVILGEAWEPEQESDVVPAEVVEDEDGEEDGGLAGVLAPIGPRPPASPLGEERDEREAASG